MAVNEVNKTFPPLGSVLKNQSGNTGPLVSNQPTVTTPGPVNIPRQNQIVIQAQALINETLLNLTSPQQTALRLNEALGNLSFTQQVELINASRILINEGLQSISNPPQSQLLIGLDSLLNETLVQLNNTQQASLIDQTERLLNELLQNSTPSQQAQLLIQAETLIRDTLQGLRVPSPIEPLDEGAFPIVNEQTNPVPENETVAPAPLNQTPPLTETNLPTAADTQRTGAITSQNQTVSSSAPLETRTVQTTTAAAETAIRSNPVNTAQPLEAVDPVPYGIAVYKVNSLKSTSLEPASDKKEVKPTPPIEKASLIDLILPRPNWPTDQRDVHPLHTKTIEQTSEKIIRKMINLFNEDQEKKHLPIHLVLAQSKSGLVLDIYDCSGNQACNLIYDTPLSSKDLSTLLENLQHEAGVLINTVS